MRLLLLNVLVDLLKLFILFVVLEIDQQKWFQKIEFIS